MLADSYLFNADTAGSAAGPVAQYEPASFSDARYDATHLANTDSTTGYTDNTQNNPAAQTDLYDCNSPVMLNGDIQTDDSLGAYS